MTEPHLPEKKTGLDVMQSHPLYKDAFEPIPRLISCTGVTRSWGLLSCAQNAVRWLAYMLVWLCYFLLATAQLNASIT